MSRVLHGFTRTVPQWRPRVAPVRLEDATSAQRDALQITPSNTKVSDYVLVLAHDPETLAVRSPLFNAIMYDKGGLSRADRELGAIAASIVNRCIYCAAVHAGRHVQLSGSDALTAEIYAKGEAPALPPREQALFDAAVKLSRCPPGVDGADMARLREGGVSAEEALDLVLSTALFGWANRLMHVLGDPVREDRA